MHFKLIQKKIVKYIWDILFLRYSVLAHPDRRHIHELFFLWYADLIVHFHIFTSPSEPNFGHGLCGLLKKGPLPPPVREFNMIVKIQCYIKKTSGPISSRNSMYIAYLGTYVPIVYFIKICFIQGAEMKMIFLQLILAEITSVTFFDHLSSVVSLQMFYTHILLQNQPNVTQSNLAWRGFMLFKI